MGAYIFGQRNKIHIVNLEKTLPLYQDAMSYVGKLAANGGRMLFVGTKRAAQDAVRERLSAAVCPTSIIAGSAAC
jgi:small subunit ribosomal protein S2